MNIDQFARKIEFIKNELKNNLSDVLRVSGGDVCALVANRVINGGQNNEGDLFTPYSQTKVPAYFYFNRSRSGGADKKVRAAAKKKENLSYSDFRDINNLPTDKKNFSFTNDMWRHFGVTQVNKTPNGWAISIGGLTTDAANKIAWLSGQENRSIVEPSNKEVEIITNAIASHIKKLLQ